MNKNSKHFLWPQTKDKDRISPHEPMINSMCILSHIKTFQNITCHITYNLEALSREFLYSSGDLCSKLCALLSSVFLHHTKKLIEDQEDPQPLDSHWFLIKRRKQLHDSIFHLLTEYTLTEPYASEYNWKMCKLASHSFWFSCRKLIWFLTSDITSSVFTSFSKTSRARGKSKPE